MDSLIWGMDELAVILLVKGKVQGVYYRESTRRRGLELGLTGTVRNLDDGSVMVEAQGPELRVEEFIQWCRTGPPDARVDHVDVRTALITDAEGFTVIR